MKTKYHPFRPALLRTVLAAAAFLISSISASSALYLFYINPSTQSIGVGGTSAFDLRVRIDPTADSLGGYKVDLTYDDSIVQIDSVTLGSGLDLGTFGSDQSVDFSTSGLISIFELSFEDAGDLLTLQPDDFTLATIGFTGLAPGISPVELSLLELSDELGFRPLNDAVLRDGEIVVRSQGVPETMGFAPTAFALMLLISLGHRFARRI